MQASPAPVAVPAPEAAEVEAELSIASTPMSILVVEDTPDARTMLSELLLVLGHCVEGVGSAEEALDLLAHKQFDVLLTDHSLPGMSGLELARTVQARADGMKIIFSSGYGAHVAEGLDIQPAFLPKPFTLGALQAVLDEITHGVKDRPQPDHQN